MSIIQLNTPATNGENLHNHLLTKINDSTPQRWWIVKRISDNYSAQQFDMIFFRDLGDVINQTDPKGDRHQMLIPLMQWLDFIEVKREHSEALLEGYFNDNHQALDVHNCPLVALAMIRDTPERLPFISDELAYESFALDDLVPIYMVNLSGELEREQTNNPPHCEFYIQLEHIEFAEFVFRAYSLLVERGEFTKLGCAEAWERYLTMMQENALAENLEEIHRAYWLSLCPDLSSVANTIKGVN